MGTRWTRMLVLAGLFVFPVFGAFSQYRAAVLELPTSEQYVNLVKAIAADRKVTIEVEVVPTARASFLLRNQKVDFLVPTGRALVARKVGVAMEYAAPLFPMAFVLYTNKRKPVDLEDLRAGNRKGARIETSVSTVESFGFPASPSYSIEASLKKVDAQVIDGLLYSQASGDSVLRQLGLKSIQRNLFVNIEMSFGVAPGREGVSRLLNEGMESLRKSGKLETLTGDLVRVATWSDWQP